MFIFAILCCFIKMLSSYEPDLCAKQNINFNKIIELIML